MAIDLTAYYKTPHWRKFREFALDKRGRKCEACGFTKYLQVHHLHYRRLGCERLGDVRIVCNRCHEKITRLHHDPKYRRGGNAIGRATDLVVRRERSKQRKLGRRRFYKRCLRKLHKLIFNRKKH